MCCAFFASVAASNAATDFSDYSVFGSASSTVNSRLKIGALTDSESSITANTAATGDDITGSDDEDGVTVPASIVAGTTGSLTVNVTNTMGSSTFLNVWIDFNRNGVLTDSGEQIATNTVIANNTSNSNKTVSFTVPATASLGTVGVRVRLTSTSTPGSTGLSGSGEVEDYVMTITPNTDYGDYPSFPAATQVANSIIRIGTNATDTEASNPTTGAANADDNTGTDDEDLTMPVLTAGTGTTLAIPVTVTTGSLSGGTARINVFADWTGDNDVTDTNETLTTQTVSGSGTYNFTLTPPAGTSPGTKYLRIRITEGSTAPTFSGTSTLKGEVEDYAITVVSNDTSDYSGFATASSTVNSTLRLGPTVDAELSATTNATATGDDITGIDDEDGVTVPASFKLSTSSTLTVNVSNTSGATAFLNAWIDYNQNGVLTDSGEQIATNTVIANGTSNSNKTVTFTVPSNAVLGTTGVRVRLTSTSSPGSTGASGSGEVEDYTVVIASSLGIGNLIWNDANENGLFDAGESGIDNVLVELWSPGADNAIGGTGSNADTKVASTTTAGGGLYGFSGLTAGYYFVKVPTPPLSRTSLVVDTSDNGQDDDNNGSQPGGSGTSAYSPVIQIAAGTEPGSTGTGNIDNTIDFGFAANIGAPFVCDNRFWIVQNAETSPGSGVYDATLYYVGDGPSLVPAFFFSGYKLNGLAAYGGYLYCVDQNDNHLYRINSQGVLVDMGAIPGLPSPGATGQWSGATALTNGRMILNLYNFSPSSTQLYTIDLTSASLVGSAITVTNTGTGTTYAGNFGDIVWDPLTGNVYGYSTVDTNWLGLFQINITTGAATRVSSAVPGAWGSMIIDANGLTYGFGSAGSSGNQDTLYVFNRTSGVLNGSITAVGTGPAVSNSDGAACPGAPPSMKMGNLVWNDVNNNGLKDSGESGIDGVTLQLFLGGQDPLTAAPAATVTTAGGGLYTFNNLSPGQYFVYMPTPPAAYPLSSTTTVTLDNSVDNDDNGIQTSQGQPVRSPLIGLAGGTESITDGDTDPNTDLTIDFGFLACPAITLTPTTVAAATVGMAYTQTITANGGASPYTWAVSTGTLPTGLSLNSSTGVLSGTPTSSAATSFTLRATDKNGCLGTRAYTLTPACTTITVTPSTLPDATVGSAYSQTFSASGGTATYTWAVSSGTLPAGLALSSAGILSGTPTTSNAAGTSVTFRATDAYGCQKTAVITLQVCPVVTLSPTTLPAPTVGSVYSQTLTASGGATAYTFTLANGSLPSGLSLSSAGVLSGTATNTTSATFTVQATDANVCPGTRAYTLAAICPTITVTPTTLPDGTNGTAYSQTLTASGGTASYTWAVSSGTLPAGLTLSTAGVISGTPTTSNGAGTNITFRATDTYGCQGTAIIGLQICPVITVSPTTLSTAIQGAPYSQTVSSSGGGGAYVYSIVSGALPAGVTIAPGTGIISGTPTTTGTANFTVQSMDANGCPGTRALSILTNVPVTDFGDYPVFAAASQIASTEIHVGTAATDVEPVNPTTGTADVDDLTGTDDEDLVIPSVVSGGDLNVNIPVTLSGSVSLGRIGVWADWNGDGDTLDANETVTLTSSGLIGGSNTITATFSPPAGTSIGTKYLRIIVVEGTTAPAFSGTSSLKGEVEDYAITVTAPTLDYGDLPDTIIGTSASNYQTYSNDNGPAHTATTNLRLGAGVSAEGNGQPNSTATGDTFDDGVPTLPTLIQNQPATLTMNATNSFGSAGFLKAWIDWNNDGNLTADEELGSEISVPNGTSNGAFSFTFTVPSSAVLGANLGLRVRLASATIPASTGVVGSGEVEDYLVTVNTSTSDFGDYPNFAAASRVASTLIKIGTAATDVETSNPTTGNATVDDTTGTDDEDLTMPALTVGVNGTLIIPVTLASPVTTGKIAVFADWNGDNVVSGTNETVTLSTSSLVTGMNTITATLSPPAGTTGGTKFLRIIVSEGATVPAFSGSSSLRGEVEDYAISVNAYTLDFGDLPDTGPGTSTGNYQTLNSDSGPSHTITPTTLRLGATVDAEADGQPNATATGDGADEDGIASMPVFNRGQAYSIPVSVFNNTGSTARVFAFIDWNNDGDFADAGETFAAVAVSSSATQQTVNITGTTPGTVTLGTFGARFRLATATTLASTGTTANGEVEDYIATGSCPTLTITPTSLPATAQYASYNQTLTAANGTTPYTWTIATGSIPGGLTLSSTGVLSGTVISASGAYVFTARATDANGCTVAQSYTISVGTGGMSVGNLVFLDENNNGLKDANERGIPNVPVEIWSTGADGRVNSADDQPVTTGNASTLDSGGMFTLGGFGTIASGYSTLTARTDWNGLYQFTALPTGSFYLKITPPNKTVFSSKFGSGTTTYSLNLDFPLASSNAVLIDNGIDNDSNGVQTTGSFTGSSDAVVAGVGAAVFTMPFTLATATEPGNSNLGSDEYTIDFGLRPCPAIGITPITVPAVSSGVAYSTTLSSAGGVAPYTYVITQGTLPTGLSLSTAGTISGTTSTTGTSAITVRAIDARGCQGFTTIQLSVTTAMSITTASLPNGTEGTAYTSTTLAATGASTPYQNWRVSSGTLPTGLAVNSTTGLLSGTPTSPGTYVFTVAVDDALVTPASVTVTNGSVETDAWSAVTFTPRSTVTGWTLGNSALTGTTTAVQLYGINNANTNNTQYGHTPAGSQYLASPFVGSWASQTVSGFTVGRPYTMRVRYAMRGAYADPATAEAPPPFYGDALWIAGYNASAASLFGPVSVNFPVPSAANYDNWATLDVPFVPQAASMVFAYGLDGAAIDDVQFIPTAAGTVSASKQYTVVITGNRDWGDLPDTGIGTGTGNYQTTNSDSAPSHYRNTNLRLGTTLDIEPDGQPDATATGDDLNGVPNDEDAIATLPVFARGQSFTIPVSVFNNIGSTANVFAFIDWNNDGDFLDPFEALTSVSVSSNASQQSVNVTGIAPGFAALTKIGLRVRLSTASTLGAFGLATNGEVEDYMVTPTCPAVTLNPASLANGTLSSAYSQNITAAGGTGPYTYALSSGTLPSGFTLNTTSGVLSGTPNVAGTFNFTLSATDANGCAGAQTYAVVMSCPTLAITPVSLTAGTVGTAYSQTLSASGGAAPYGAWTITSGTLPAGLTLSTAGVISGTPTTSNASGVSFTVRTTDANGCQGAQAVTLKICPVITLSPTTLAASIVNSAYSQTLTATGSATAYTYTVSSGTLPAGLSLSAAGVISGAPTSTTSRTFTVTATDANGCPGSRAYTIAPACPTLTVTPVTATRATVGTAYTQTLSASGGLAPYGTWTVTSGTLPTGLALNASTGIISGTPTTTNALGTSVTFHVTDANGCTGSQAITLQVCPVIALAPATLPNGTINTAYSQTVSASGGTSPYAFTVGSGTLPTGLTLSSTGVLSGTPTSTVSVSFTLTATDANGCSGSLAYTMAPAPDSDFGDYSPFASASSRMIAALRIGALTDVEASATTNTTATGDDITGVDDEDGVTLPASITQGGAGSIMVNVTNTSGASAFLNAWIDFNQNGSLTDAGEQIASNTVIANGTSNTNRTLSFTAPANAVLGSAGVRVRLTSTSSPGSVGASGNGEVEDNVATIVAPTTDYGDFQLFADAYSTGSTNLMLGTLVDLEGSATKDTSATGDDLTGIDDEEAVTFPSMTAGQPMVLPVTVTNLTGSTAFLNAWIDYNNNGVLTDAGEQIATNVNIITGTNGGTVNLNFNVPTNAVTAAALIGARFRITNVPTPGSTGGVGIGEVEDHTVVILAPLTDFGDFSGAPNVSNTASTNLRLGALVDTEYAATTNAVATGDDITGSDDEDGVTLPAMTAGAPATIPTVVTNTTGSSAFLNAWIDYNNNGVFTDAGEQIATNTLVPNGTTNSTFNLSTTVPAAAVTGTNLGVRVRISSDNSPGSTGAGGVGEVEDYVINIDDPTTDFGDYSLFGIVSSTTNSRLRIGALTDTEYTATTNATATGDDITGVDDEDGVTFPSMIAGAPATVSVVLTNTTGASAFLNAWIDFNGNGSLADPGEQIVSNLLISNGTNNSTLSGSISIPTTTLTGVNLGARVMLTTAASPASTGSVGTGEIEDYVVNITAPTTDFGDFSGFADASQGVSPSLRMGDSVDAEYVSTRDATATGDDLTGIDDEDGVTLPAMIAGQKLTIPVVASNSTGAMGYLNAWIDFNNNGVLTDAGEQIATNINVATGSSDTTFNINLTVPSSAVTGTNLGARFRLSAPTSPGPTGANAAVGEVEDYVVNIAAPTLDYSDFSRFGNAASTANNNLRMGALVDTEPDATTNTAATGDNITGLNDEDGVTIPTLTAGSAATITVKVTNKFGSTGFLNAWIDYNNNGDLTDAGEQIATNTAIVTGTSNVTKNISITVPLNAVAGTPVGLRFRFTSVSSPGSTGTAGSGEVEDYVASIIGPTSDYGDWSGIADASNTIVSSLRLGALIDAEFSSTRNATATGDDITNLADEDGVTLPAMTAGGTFTMPIVVTNTSGSGAFLNAWMDFNNNGSFNDAGEQFATNVNVASGSSNATLNQSIIVPASAVTGTSLGMRFRLTSASSPGSTGTGGGNGEVEDYVASITAPTTDFGDFSSFANAWSTVNSKLRIGALTDTEYAATTNTTATGDDITGVDDEDGVTLPSMTAGAPATIPVIVTNTTGATAFLNAWIDYNNNGVLTDAGEQIATNVTISSGTNNNTLNISASVPANAVTGTNLGVRVRLTSIASPGSSGAAGTGEVEDYIVSLISPPLDYGDWSGVADAASNATNALRLGALIDTEYASTRNAAATGDDITGIDDEDGVTLPAMIAGAPTTIPVIVTNTTGTTAYLNAWIDYNNNGILTDAGEQIATNITIANGTTNSTLNLNITVPADAATGSNVGVRFRLTDVATPGVTGIVGNGEVEDYVTSIAVPTTDFGDWSGAADASSIASSNLRMGALADTEYVSTRNATATGDDITGSADEDGVTLPSQTPGTAGSATVVVTNNSGAPGYLNAWIDYNNNGSFTDAGEQIATNTVVSTGTNGVTQTVSFIVPVTAIPGQRGTRFRLTSTQNPTSVGASGMGEVEDYLVTLTCLPIALSPTTLTTPAVGTAYSQSVSASGGMGPYTYSLGSGTLPAGLTLSNAGVLSGTPTSSNAATFTLVATDSYSCTASNSYTLTPVCPTVTVNTSTLPSGAVGTAYSQTLSASGGAAGYTFAVSSGTLPAGLSLNASTGLISGTPTTSNAGGVSLTFRATDANGCAGTRPLTLIICPVITLTPTTLPTPNVGAAYSQSISATGSTTAYTYALASGALPAWATLSPAGVLTGTPTSTASATFTLRATDANGCTGTRSYTVTPACLPITLSPATLVNGMVNSAYSQTLTSSGGNGTMTYAISSGSLPAGLSLNASTGAISGTPTSTTAATFTVRATDVNACTGTASYTVTPACPVITVSPATLTTGAVGVAYSQTLSATGGIAPYTAWAVTSGTLPAGLTLNASSGVITGSPTTGNGTGVSLTLRATDANGCQGSTVVSLKICPVITQSPASPTAPVVGTAYSQAITGAGGVSPYTFALASGALPVGLSVSSSGIISGTTTSASTASFTLRATAADGCSGTTAFTLTPTCPVLTISPSTTLATAYLGTAYTQALTASGGTGPYTFALQSGDLPGGILLSPNGTLNGTPTAKGSFPVTVRVTDANACPQSFNLTLQVHTLSIGNLVYEDSNNNGVKDTGEPGVANALVQLFATGDDNAIGGSGTAADVQTGSNFATDATGAYLFSALPAGNYYLKVTPPADYLFTGGTPDTADDNIDNNNDGAQPGGSGTALFSPVINLSGGAESITDGDTDPDTNLTVDFGLWSSVAVGNMIFLDINGDGFRNEGESLGGIYVELYAQGATPGVDDPVSVGTSGCSCQGRYYLDSLNPGTYFLHIPASQFTTGAPLAGLQPMSNVVAGDDDIGQDLIFNNNPAVNGASTGLFSLRPGFCPVGSAESGAEGTSDDAMDARVDLTRDLGVVAPAGTGFAASEAIRRYIVTGGFTASVLPGASTFATWSQNSAIGTATADPDEDGLPNLLEYALGTDPGNPLQPNRFALTQDPTTGSVVALLTQPTATHDDLIVSLETLTDLTQAGNASAWKRLNMATTTTINADGTLTRAYANLEQLLVFHGLNIGFIHLRIDLDANRDGIPEATVTSHIQGWGRQSLVTGSRTFSMPLLNAGFFTGLVSAVSANQIVLPVILTLPAGSLYLEALDGPLAGQRFDIDATASSGNTVVLSNTPGQSYADLAHAHITIRLHHTLAELLPPTAFTADDRVLFFDPVASDYTTCTNTAGSWLNDVLSMNARPFPAHEAVLLQIRGSGNTFLYTGEVRQTPFVTPLVAGTQLIAPGWPLATPAPVTGLNPALTPDTADRLRLWDGDLTPDASSYTGYYLDSSTTPPTWVPQTAPTPAASVLPFHGFFLIRNEALLLQQSAPW
jgi:hypothetical protein